MNSSAIPSENQTTTNLPCGDLITPPLKRYWLEVDSVTTALIATSCFEAIIILILYGVCVHFITLYVSSRIRASRLLWLCGIFPVSSTISCVGMVVPRSMALSDGVAILYISRCMFEFVDLVLHCLGEDKRVQTKVEILKLNTGPCCCCCCCPCVPDVKPTERNLKIVRLLVYQVALIRPIVMYVNIVLWLDRWGEFEPTAPWRPFLATIVVISTLLAMYGVNIIHNASKVQLFKFKMHVIMAFMQLMLVIYNMQSPLFSVFGGYIGCEEQLLPSYAKAFLWHHFVVVAECLVMLSLAMWFCRPSSNEIFDRYHRVKCNNSSSSRTYVAQEPVTTINQELPL
uniref:Organic solute transporter alpha-like protein n=1 Tax=Trichuris muris TaxID=70415 RepID=A0A5S6R546_TRIMR